MDEKKERKKIVKGIWTGGYLNKPIMIY